MDPQHWAKIESLYHAALAMAPGDRGASLANANACKGEPDPLA
jgi:hypothetical protein